MAREAGGRLQGHEVKWNVKFLFEARGQLKELPAGHSIARQVQVPGLRRIPQGAAKQYQSRGPRLPGQRHRALKL